VDDWTPVYYREPGECGPWAHSSAIAKKLLHIFMEGYNPQGISSVHLKEDIEFHVPVPFGEVITLKAVYSDKFVRKGRPSVVLDGEARDAAGNLLVTQRSIEIVPTLEPVGDVAQADPSGLSSRKVTVGAPDNAATVSTAADVSEAGVVLPVMSKTIHQDQMSVFVGANEGWRNIHTDLEVAKAAGFEKTIMSGMIQACWFTEMMVRFFGESFLSGGKLGVTFLKSVQADETITCHAVVRSRADDGEMEIEFWSLNAEGASTAVGWAVRK